MSRKSWVLSVQSAAPPVRAHAWSLVRQAGRPAGNAGTWQLHTGAAPTPAARVTMTDDTAWRLFFTARKSEDLLAAIHIDGDRKLGSAVTKALAVMA